ncbi:MAG: glycosyltransferase [Vicinamibacterales bacterium]
MISVVVVYNDLVQFDAFLRPSLARQSAVHEVLALDNRDHRYTSAAAALNEGARRARGDHLFFVHQDVRLESPSWLDDAEQLLGRLPDLGIAGVSGARPIDEPPGREVVTCATYDDPPRPAGTIIDRPVPVETVDECAFFVPRAVATRLPFDERTCDGWHLYAVDYALSAAKLGLSAWALPLPLYHRSTGSLIRVMGFSTFDWAYFRAVRRVMRKHPDRVLLHTTCGRWDARRSLFVQQFPPDVVWFAWRVWLRRRLGSSG